ncbi:hypothetical protein OUZ56_010323 [Daphnia magna]|uniref:Chromo domain-containing protein n=1 Tax=Daphnia magna TaxID=35525 RepID=A0ABR0AI76_9CRUS|nr:hypothetical protein OUZ56_010323 [Daphnia magna]
MVEDEDPEYEVEEILERRLYPNEKGLLRVWYLVKFKNYPDTDNQWLPAKNTNCRALVRAFITAEKKKKQNIQNPIPPVIHSPTPSSPTPSFNIPPTSQPLPIPYMQINPPIPAEETSLFTPPPPSSSPCNPSFPPPPPSSIPCIPSFTPPPLSPSPSSPSFTPTPPSPIPYASTNPPIPAEKIATGSQLLVRKKKKQKKNRKRTLERKKKNKKCFKGSAPITL